MIYIHWFIITNHDSNDSCCAMMNQWLWIMDCYAVPKFVNHGELCWASGCESWCGMLSQWLWVMVCNAEPEVVNHGVLWWMIHKHWAQHSISWFTTTLLSIIHHDSQLLGLAYHTLIHNHWLRITYHDWQPLAQNNTPWFTTTGSV
jgi:hypothetical protein